MGINKAERTSQKKEKGGRAYLSRKFSYPRKNMFSFKFLCLKKCNIFRLYANVHGISNPL